MEVELKDPLKDCTALFSRACVPLFVQTVCTIISMNLREFVESPKAVPLLLAILKILETLGINNYCIARNLL